MAPQLCVMNCAQGSPPSAAHQRPSAQDEAAGGVGHDNLNLASLKRCKSRGPDLPFSVESLISDSRSSPEPDSGRVRVEETECASPSGTHRSKSEAADFSEDTGAWLQGSYASSISMYFKLYENNIFFFTLLVFSSFQIMVSM